ncbi:MAG: hypothetical protein HYV45_00800 [Candidatus Moranbacteria bacterium]|nr:hypothetical protein [Candidatus Moranbacteria bacterium]
MALNEKTLEKDLIATFHLEELPKEKQQALLARIGEALLRRVFLETMEKLDTEDVVLYERLVKENASQEQMETFLENKIPGYNVFVRGVVAKFTEEMKRATAQ